MAEETTGAAAAAAAAQQQQRHEAIKRRIERFMHGMAVTMVVVTPVLLALPPRKLDLYSLALTNSFVLSANWLTLERTGRGILDHVTGRRPRQEQHTQTTTTTTALEAAAAAKGRWGVVGVAASRRSNDEAQGWKERRWREDRDKMAQGQGYGSIILDQIWEVWNQEDKNKADDIKDDKNNGLSDQTQQDERARRRGGGVSGNG